jgi:thermolysin
MKNSRRWAILALIVVAAVLVSTAVHTQPARGRRVSVAATAPAVVSAWNDVLVQMERNGDLRITQVDDDSLVPGRRFEHLEQSYNGVPIWGANLVRETDGVAVKSVFGKLHQDVELNTAPHISGDQAKGVIAEQLGITDTSGTEPALVVLPKDDGTYVLAWQVSYFTGTGLPVVFVNANTRAIELQYDNLQRQTPAIGHGTGTYGDSKKVMASSLGSNYLTYDNHYRPVTIATYDMKGNLTREQLVESRGARLDWSDVAFDSDNDWSDPAVVDAQTYLGFTYDYFYKRFGRHGFDGNDQRPVQALIHSVRRQDFDVTKLSTTVSYYLNAWFCPRCAIDGTDTLMFGEGLPSGWTSGGQSVNYFSASLDIVAHEYTHGVTSYTSNLTYIKESGALNEAFSDVMGVCVEFMFQPVGDGVLKADWLQGEDTMRATLPGSKNGGRSLSDPQSLGYPDHYSKRYTGTGDNGGVHTNSTIVSHAFYLAVEGGTNRTSGISVQGVGDKGRDQIEKIFYRAFTTLPTNATFYDARLKTIDSARTLYGTGSAAEQAVTQAWDAVGVTSAPPSFGLQDDRDRFSLRAKVEQR